ncbi:MAG: hypothetical protein HYX69_13465 [Planctomycetia bacterium]|nr:hypothetical protein [Planctomycetia bacterium]
MTCEPRGDSPCALGFLTVVETASQGLVGGYLLLDVHARPLEFHCTAPVKANRAQEILYGPTLAPYLYGEQIGRTLVRASRLRPLAVFTDRPAALSTAMHVDVSVWLVVPPDRGAPHDAASADERLRLDAPHVSPCDPSTVPCGRNRLARPTGVRTIGDQGAAASVDQRLAAVAGPLDLAEPFDRIRAAIEEAQRGAR